MLRSQIFNGAKNLTPLPSDPLLARLTVASEAFDQGYEYANWSGDVYRVVAVETLPACLGERVTAWVNTT